MPEGEDVQARRVVHVPDVEGRPAWEITLEDDVVTLRAQRVAWRPAKINVATFTRAIEELLR